MPGIDPDFLYHKLSITPGTRPMYQKKRRLGDKKRLARKEETAKLLQACFVRELANVVMVRKSSGKWRMCMNYTYLNKACLKDPYPWPDIDDLVDGMFGFGLLSFMYAYSGNNQIKMHPRESQRWHSLQMRNAGATYQRLMDRIFKDHIGCQLEVYIDGMVVKSDTKSQHIESLTSIFSVLREHQLKLKPNKCSFEVKARKFLGFMLIKRGIEMRSHKNVKEVQQLAGRITALARFLSQSTEKEILIFQCLRKTDCF
ncbi:hypothetical protein CR513_13111, partial [Mucuna pruriens]